MPTTAGRRLLPFAVALLIASLISAVPIVRAPSVSRALASAASGTGGEFVPTQERVLDTRSASQVGPYGTAMPAGAWRTVQITGVGGIPTSAVSAVALTFTVLSPAVAGQLYADKDEPTPNSTVTYMDFHASENQSTSATLAVADDGKIQVAASQVTNLLVEVQGYYTSDETVAPGGYVPVTPQRLVNTSDGTGLPQAKLSAGSTTNITVAGQAGVPQGASAVMVNFTVFNNTATSDHFYTPYPADAVTRPQSELTFADGLRDANSAQVGLAMSGASAGSISFYLSDSNYTIDLAVDVVGYFTAEDTSGAFTPAAARVYDSRTGGHTTLAGGASTTVPVAGVSGVPVMSSGLSTVTTNLQVIHPGSSSVSNYATMWADGATRPTPFSSLNYQANSTTSNMVTSAVGSDGAIEIYNAGSDPIDFVVDIEGWYLTRPAAPQFGSEAIGQDGWVESGTPNMSVDISEDETVDPAANIQYAVDGGTPITSTSASVTVDLSSVAAGHHVVAASASDAVGAVSDQATFAFDVGTDPQNPPSVSTAAGLDSNLVRWTVPSQPASAAPAVDFFISIHDVTQGTTSDVGQCDAACRAVVVSGLSPADAYTTQVTLETALGSVTQEAKLPSNSAGAAATCGATPGCESVASDSEANSNDPDTLSGGCPSPQYKSGDCLPTIVEDGGDPYVAAEASAISLGRVSAANTFVNDVAQPAVSSATLSVMRSALSTASSDRQAATDSLDAYNTNVAETAASNSADDTLPESAPLPDSMAAAHRPKESTHGSPKATSLYSWVYHNEQNVTEGWGYVDGGGYHHRGDLTDTIRGDTYFQYDGAHYYHYIRHKDGPKVRLRHIKVRLMRDWNGHPDTTEDRTGCPHYSYSSECDWYGRHGTYGKHWYYFRLDFDIQDSSGQMAETQIQSRRYQVLNSSNWQFIAANYNG